MPPAPDKEIASLPDFAPPTVQLLASAADDLNVINDDSLPAGDTTASDSEVWACPQYPDTDDELETPLASPVAGTISRLCGSDDGREAVQARDGATYASPTPSEVGACPQDLDDTDDEPEVGLDITADKNPAALDVCSNKLDDDQKSQTSTWSASQEISNTNIKSTFLHFKDVQAPSRRVKTMPPAPDKEVASLPELVLSTVQVLASAAVAEATAQKAEEEAEKIAEEAAPEAIAQKEREEAEPKAHPAWADIIDEFHDYTITASLASDNVVATDLPATTEVVSAPCQPSSSVKVVDGATYAFPTPPPLGSGFTFKDGKYQLKLSSGLEITFKDGTYHAQWDVDAKRFTKNDHHMVSPEFNMWFSGKAVPYHIGSEPTFKNFKDSQGKGRLYLKCRALSGEEQTGITRFQFFLGSHGGAEVQSEEHNFSNNCKSNPASALNFKAANDRGSVHIHLEVSQEPEVIEPEVIVLEETEPEVTTTEHVRDGRVQVESTKVTG